jgi:hypothetical protein
MHKCKFFLFVPLKLPKMNTFFIYFLAVFQGYSKKVTFTQKKDLTNF